MHKTKDIATYIYKHYQAYTRSHLENIIRWTADKDNAGNTFVLGTPDEIIGVVILLQSAYVELDVDVIMDDRRVFFTNSGAKEKFLYCPVFVWTRPDFPIRIHGECGRRWYLEDFPHAEVIYYMGSRAHRPIRIPIHARTS